MRRFLKSRTCRHTLWRAFPRNLPECSAYAYAVREQRNGMTVHIREGSAARNLQDIVQGIVENHMSTEGFCFCTYDKHIEDIRREGHINYNVRKAIALGISYPRHPDGHDPASQALNRTAASGSSGPGLSGRPSGAGGP